MLLSKEKRREGLNFANELVLLGMDAPDVATRRAIGKVVAQIRRKYGYTQEEKKAFVLKRIGDGAGTAAQLSEETGFDIRDVYEILNELQSKSLIEMRKISVTGNGRPSRFFILKD